MKYAIIDQHASEIPVRKACELLDARRQGYYEWRLGSKSPRQLRDELLTAKVKNVFFESRRIYGARKIVAVLAQHGEHVSRRRVRRLMAAAGLWPLTFRKRRCTTDSGHALAVFPNLLGQNHIAAAPDRVWVSDFTYLATDEGWLYLCTVMDLYSRRVVGWATSQKIDRQLAIAALNRALENRHPGKEWIFHSDRGSQYASLDFRSAVLAAGGLQSMSRPGNPYDNACAESFFKSLKVEFVNTMHFPSRAQAERAVAEYMLFYNRARVHAFLGYLTPAQFECDPLPRSTAS